MGFTGHMIIGSFMLSLSAWWMFNIFRDYLLSKKNGSAFKSRVSYPITTCPRIPLESGWKIFAFTFVLLCEIGSSRLTFIDPADGGFRAGAITNLQHMTMYGMFALHALFDLLTWKFPVPEGVNSVTLSMALIWSGVSIRSGHNTTEFLIMIHMLPTYVMFVAAAVILVELYSNHSNFIASAVRTSSVMILGTWFIQMAFISFDRHQLTGVSPNPHWDQTDERNIHILVAIFGGHIIMNMIVAIIVYIPLYVVYGRGTYDYKYNELGEGHEKLLGAGQMSFIGQQLK
ncbi:transmembrane protein 45A-like [Mizuhopecten yessoensis]|uniref:transmembrane protein 45A-like n=1 Tax=Mizuhopecten yessoensis TaxID=6573 RepID=UPI000B45A2A1|nr:transmembrane protein 45A-like [Mizuhopecten yessoensis]